MARTAGGRVLVGLAHDRASLEAALVRSGRRGSLFGRVGGRSLEPAASLAAAHLPCKRSRVRVPSAASGKASTCLECRVGAQPPRCAGGPLLAEGRNDGRGELRSGAACELGERPFGLDPLAVWALAGHRLERVAAASPSGRPARRPAREAASGHGAGEAALALEWQRAHLQALPAPGGGGGPLGRATTRRGGSTAGSGCSSLRHARRYSLEWPIHPSLQC
jgi:hypothetical protein